MLDIENMTDNELLALANDKSRRAIDRMNAWLHNSDRSDCVDAMHEVVADYAALEARIAELKRRIAEIVAMLEPKRKCPCGDESVGNPGHMSELKQKVDAARAMVSALCLPRGHEGSREWIMSIPARPDHDPDLVIAAALNGIQELIAANAELQRRLDEIVAMLDPGEEPNSMDPKYNPSRHTLSLFQFECHIHDMKKQLHQRAVAIAEGRGNG